MKAAAAFLMALLAWTCAAAGELRVAVSRGPVSLPLYVAEAKGYFAAEGVQVQFSECSSGRECFERLRSGAADLATSAELIVALDSLTAASSTVVAIVSSSTRQLKLLARKSAGIWVPDDLVGKRVGTVARTSAEFFLENWLLYHGLAATQIKVVPLPIDQLVDRLANGQLDAIAIWEPTASQAVARLGADIAPLDDPRVYRQHFVLSVDKARLASVQGDVQRLLKALGRAEALIASRPQEAAGVLAARLKLDPVAARGAAAEHDYRLSLAPSLLSTMDAQARWAIREGVVPAGPGTGAVALAVEPGPLRSVDPAAVTLPQSSRR